ncbi:putative uncharacterized protein DDB_G0277255 isoform X2 [Drosophila innubila]|uniref:putative uncharacterized protein DDB_G0277255 isoform X2 n=1 Tax=Drosophila innubila TaxID=198719 RepID=UPI00148D2903|nr:putative uncharacterized protein DDB_G0277255 isoform X2 [Drosophila innubila]
MDMDNASWAMDQLRAATEENDGMFTSPSDTHTDVSSSSRSANPNSVTVTTPYVSQFRIDGQPILPPLMTAERRRQMQLLRQRALELEAKYKQSNAVRSTTILDETRVIDSDSSSGSNSNSSSNDANSSTMSTIQRFPQLQQTQTFIYDSTRQQSPHSSPRNRPQTLNVANNVIPTICVNPPTPLRGDNQPPKPPPSPSPPKVQYSRMLGTPRRKLNNITSRIMQFELTGKGEQLQLEPQPMQLLWQNKELSAVDKRMLRSSTSPSLNAGQTNGMQMQRSRSFTLEEPSPALVEHMKREGSKAPIPPPLFPPAVGTAAITSGVAQTSPRCRFVLPAGSVSCCSSAQSLAHLRRDTVESKAKQVQRSVSSSCVDLGNRSTSSAGRRCGGHTRNLQNQQQQLKQLLQRALHEADDVLDEQDQEERKQLTLAKRQMLKDIKSAHRDRFQQLMQYQHEEQRRMQAEFDRQQKFLIEQICADINVSAYAPLSTELSPSGISEYTSTDDLPTPSRSSQNDTLTLSSKDSALCTARKRLFDVDNESDAPSELLPIDSATSSPKSITNNSSNSNNNSSNNNTNAKAKIKKPIQRSHSKAPAARKVTSPVLPSKTPPARRATNKTTTTITKGKPQQPSLSKTRRSASPSRQSRKK